MADNTEVPAVDKTQADYLKAQQAALDAQAKADIANSGKTPEQVKADEAAQKADDLRAKAAETNAAAAAAAAVPMTVLEAGTLAVVAPETMAGDHLAQKFGNDPANPKLADGIKPDENLVKLSRKTPDVQGLVYCEVPKEMAGDYMRAGWNAA